MEDLSRAAGITKSSFYHHVSGKEELLRAADEAAGQTDGGSPERIVRRGDQYLVAVVEERLHRLGEFLEAGWQGDMGWLGERCEARADPRRGPPGPAG